MLQKNDDISFWFTGADLSYYLEPHEFYVSEAKRRLLSRFSDIEQEVQEKEEQYLEWAGEHFNPDYDDPVVAYEQAHDAAIYHAWSLIEMQNTVILALTASMYHQFDKKLREKVIREFRNWLDPSVVAPLIWGVNYPRLIELLEWVGIKISGEHFGEKLKACTLVVNVYKHGEGESHKALSARYPEYYSHSSTSDFATFPPRHDDLQVTEEQFVEFADAIATFWKSMPEYCRFSQLNAEPDWLEKVYINIKKKLPVSQPSKV